MRFSSSSIAASPAAPRDGCAPASSPKVSRPHCTSITRTPGSSSITRSSAPCAPRPRSTTPMTSASANDCTTCRNCGKSASAQTAGCSTSSASAASPIAILALTSDTLTRGQIYDAASTVMQQALSRIEGIGQVAINGSSLPAVRVELNPSVLFKYQIGFEDVRAALASANAHSPKGAVEEGDSLYQIYANDQANRAVDYRP